MHCSCFRACYRALLMTLSRLYFPIPIRANPLAMARNSKAFFLCIKGSAACRINATTSIVTPMSKEAGRVIRPSAQPPKRRIEERENPYLQCPRQNHRTGESCPYRGPMPCLNRNRFAARLIQYGSRRNQQQFQ